jgi:hypothetical protein
MKRVQTIRAKAALLSVLGIGLSACVAAVPEPVPPPGSVAAVPAPAAPEPTPGYYYPYGGSGYYYPCCAMVPNIGLDFDFHGGHRFGRR